MLGPLRACLVMLGPLRVCLVMLGHVLGCVIICLYRSVMNAAVWYANHLEAGVGKKAIIVISKDPEVRRRGEGGGEGKREEEGKGGRRRGEGGGGGEERGEEGKGGGEGKGEERGRRERGKEGKGMKREDITRSTCVLLFHQSLAIIRRY